MEIKGKNIYKNIIIDIELLTMYNIYKAYDLSSDESEDDNKFNL